MSHAAQVPIVVGDVYQIGHVVRFKITISYGGTPVDGIFPTVTVVRDVDNYAADFTLGEFVQSTPASLGNSNFRDTMTPLGLGTYYYDFDPTEFGSMNSREVYTVIYKHDTAPYQIVTHEEFVVAESLAGAMSTGFGLLARCCNVCRNTQTKIAYQALSGQTDVRISIYNPHGTLIVSEAAMQELGSTGIYQYTFIGQVDGQHTIIAHEETNGTRDAMLLEVGGDCERLKRIEQLLLSLNLQPPSVGPCS